MDRVFFLWRRRGLTLRRFVIAANLLLYDAIVRCVKNFPFAAQFLRLLAISLFRKRSFFICTANATSLMSIKGIATARLCRSMSDRAVRFYRDIGSLNLLTLVIPFIYQFLYQLLAYFLRYKLT